MRVCVGVYEGGDQNLACMDKAIKLPPRTEGPEVLKLRVDCFDSHDSMSDGEDNDFSLGYEGMERQAGGSEAGHPARCLARSMWSHFRSSEGHE